MCQMTSRVPCEYVLGRARVRFARCLFKFPEILGPPSLNILLSLRRTLGKAAHRPAAVYRRSSQPTIV